ncbi:hypothetical protein M0804_008324 [Polistes exclamans]|nr:hypothetical protein M0804_008324 [Polistes exclamans]
MEVDYCEDVDCEMLEVVENIPSKQRLTGYTGPKLFAGRKRKRCAWPLSKQKIYVEKKRRCYMTTDMRNAIIQFENLTLEPSVSEYDRFFPVNIIDNRNIGFGLNDFNFGDEKMEVDSTGDGDVDMRPFQSHRTGRPPWTWDRYYMDNDNCRVLFKYWIPIIPSTSNSFIENNQDQQPMEIESNDNDDAVEMMIT